MLLLGFPPCAQRGEVAPSYGDGGVMGRTDALAYDPSAPAGHLPGFAREEQPELEGAALMHYLAR